MRHPACNGPISVRDVRAGDILRWIEGDPMKVYVYGGYPLAEAVNVPVLTPTTHTTSA
jgi:hypothetical protein